MDGGGEMKVELSREDGELVLEVLERVVAALERSEETRLLFTSAEYEAQRERVRLAAKLRVIINIFELGEATCTVR